jgi:predicted transcriptional regulator
MRPSSFKLTPAIEKLLDELAAARNVSRAAVVREALVAYAARSVSSAAAAAGDLVGSLRGPRDLSTSPKHLKDFGE